VAIRREVAANGGDQAKTAEIVKWLVAVLDTVGVSVRERVAVRVGDCERVGVGVCERVAVRVGDWERVGEWDLEAE
jgi:hypothetical protein